MSKHKDSSDHSSSKKHGGSKKHSGSKKSDKKRSKDEGACEVTKGRVRAHFLDGETGPWAKRLASQASAGDDAAAGRVDVAAPSETGSPDPALQTATTSSRHRGPDYSMPSSIDIVADPVLHAISTRRSISKVDAETPSDSDLREIMRTISSVADHKGLRPWRFIIIRGDDRHRLGAALDEAAGVTRKPGERNEKPLRAQLLLALVASTSENPKVPEWEQHATAAGAGHLLELALWQAGWGVMWRSGTMTNEPAVRSLHRLKAGELLMGWFYIGAVPERFRERMAHSTRPLPDPDQFLETL